MFNKLKQAIAAILDVQSRQTRLEEELRHLRLALGRVEQRQTAQCAPLSRESEFQAFSQWGEDGIISRLVDLCAPKPVFIEFGVENYLESNTRFLLQTRNWKGLVIDASKANIDAIRNSALYWRHTLHAVCSFVTRDNINSLFSQNGFAGEIGLLSIDIDGMDYWVWDSINSVEPAIVICEYNAIFGADACITVPYQDTFSRHAAHSSGLYAGASLGALAMLARKKGYRLVGTNSAGNNAFFVHNRIQHQSLPGLDTATAYRPSLFREARDAAGQLLYPGLSEACKLIEDMPVYDIRSDSILPARAALRQGELQP